MRRILSSALCLAPILSVLVSPTRVASFSVKRTLGSTIVKSSLVYRKISNEYTREALISLRGGEGSSVQAVSIDSSETPISRGSEAYYLVWSPKFVPKLALATILLAAYRHFGWDHRLLVFFSGSLRFLPSGVLSNLVLPLLSSSCCAIQLAVNAVSVAIMGAGAGCIGFNTFLGPLRPYLLAVMVAYHTFQPSPSATLVRYAIALMPEFVFVWNEVLRSYWRRRNASNNEGAPENAIQATLIVEVPTMGCVACVNKIQSSLRSRAPDKIETASSWLNPKPKEEGEKKGGRAKIVVKASSRDELDDLAKSLVGAIEDAGFQGSTIESLVVQTSDTASND
mmetsp:Transcript_13393/g.33712  ORF Transcript_13393/g.33712 Transcript_13393/m.33712 type:complete len:339 (-) Transcript_13393:36-1052(-)